MEGAKATLKAMPEDRVAKLAGKDGVTVYKYVHDTPEGTMEPAGKIVALRETCVRFDQGCREHPRASNEALRERVLNSSADIRTFQRLYPKTFASCTIRVTTEEVGLELEKARKLYMLFLTEQLTGKGTQEEISARAMTMATRLAMRPTTDADRAGPFTTRLDDHPEAAGLPPLEPLDVSSFGGTVIHQT
jgi:hypothetical protein